MKNNKSITQLPFGAFLSAVLLFGICVHKASADYVDVGYISSNCSGFVCGGSWYYVTFNVQSGVNFYMDLGVDYVVSIEQGVYVASYGDIGTGGYSGTHFGGVSIGIEADGSGAATIEGNSSTGVVSSRGRLEPAFGTPTTSVNATYSSFWW
jgi:hypothetical protein